MHFIFCHIRAGVRVFLIFAWLILCLLPMVLLSFFHLPYLMFFGRFCAMGLLFIGNIKVFASGDSLAIANRNIGVLLVGNHVSYIDILALNVLFSCRFISKSDVAKWPIFGRIAKAQKTIFVERHRRKSLPETQKRLGKILFQNCPYILFAEGTSSSGNSILPFRSNLLQIAISQNLSEDKEIYLQSFCLQYRYCNGLPVGRKQRPFFAWYGDMELLPHLWNLMKASSAHVEVRLAAPIKGSDFSNRKQLAKILQTETENLLEELRQET